MRYSEDKTRVGLGDERYVPLEPYWDSFVLHGFSGDYTITARIAEFAHASKSSL